MYKKGDSVAICAIPEDGEDWHRDLTIGRTATVHSMSEDSYVEGGTDSRYLLIFDTPFEGGHSEAGKNYRNRCWNVNTCYFTKIPISAEEQARRQEARVIEKIKYLDKQFEDRQRIKNYAKNKDLSIQNGVRLSQATTTRTS